ncbi:hypothetical protein KIN20_001587 [Parelaphostrongylus tenuis]|uniref:Uncharacterized protein n=1 Tax=Parelaphostrongylus tenuis TaxID=148309 RepID=A0AAD5MF66_PARTN|nr:hypothetical protein KIN20_001587 [Parelaphostrongylus tenuis]
MPVQSQVHLRKKALHENFICDCDRAVFYKCVFYPFINMSKIVIKEMRMSLIPLTVYDNLRRACCSMFASSSRSDHSGIADRIIANASLVDVLRWRGVSRQFRVAAQRRLSRYRTIHVRVYNDLCKLYERKPSKNVTGELNWHPTCCLLLSEMSSSELGIALDSQPNWKEVKVLISLLKVFQQHATHIHMDSPVVELLVKEVNTRKINALLLFFSQNRKCDMDRICEETAIMPMMKSQLPIGPMFPSLKQFTVTSNPQQLAHLSRLVHYAVAVDMIYQKKEIDLVCLQRKLRFSEWCDDPTVFPETKKKIFFEEQKSLATGDILHCLPQKS